MLYQWRDIVPTFETRITRIRNITLRNADAVQSEAVFEIRGDGRDPIDGVTLENIRVGKVTGFYNQVTAVRNLSVKDIVVESLGSGESGPGLSGFAPGR